MSHLIGAIYYTIFLIECVLLNFWFLHKIPDKHTAAWEQPFDVIWNVLQKIRLQWLQKKKCLKIESYLLIRHTGYVIHPRYFELGFHNLLRVAIGWFSASLTYHPQVFCSTVLYFFPTMHVVYALINMVSRLCNEICRVLNHDRYLVLSTLNLTSRKVTNSYHSLVINIIYS